MPSAPPCAPRQPAFLLLLAAVALTGTLTACAEASAIGTPTSAVRVGSCKAKTTAEEMVSFSDVSPTIPCTSPHTLETYYLGSVPATLAALGPRRPDPEILTAQSADVCPLAPIRPYLGATNLDSQWGVSVFKKFPTRDEWANGLRTVVCDLVVSAPAATVPDLSVSLHNIMKYRDSARVRLCRLGADDATLETCDLPHLGERAGDVDPAADSEKQQAACAALAVQYVGGALTTGETAAVTKNAGTAECWITSTDARTGTVRGGLIAR